MYAELLAKSNFSFLKGASHPEELVERAIELGLKGLCLNDFNGLYGVVRAHQKAKSHPEFKLLIGTELTFLDHSPLVLIVKDKKAYGLLCTLITKAYQGKEKGEASLVIHDLIAALGSYASGFVILPRIEENLSIDRWRDVFPSVFLPLTQYLDGKDANRFEKVSALSCRYDLPMVATNDVYYHIKKRKIVQDVLVSIKEGKPLNEVGYKLFPNAERYLKSNAQMERLYANRPEALAKTLEIAESCHFSLSELRYYYPSEWIPKGHTAQSYLEKLVLDCAPRVYKQGISDSVKNQLQHELRLIKELNYADYFITIYDIVEFAKSRQILCQGRGSAANSVVCYVLGITSIDPIQMNLLFERFISAERGEPPDIDVDFEHERREEVIQYIYQKYGRDRAAMVSAVVTYQGRSALREVSKAFGVEVGTLSAKKVERHFDELTKNIPNREGLRAKIDAVMNEIRGFPRHLTIHSGGFTLSACPITGIVPVEPARMEGRTIIQWDKYDLDALGLLKIDVLSLGMLSALRKTLDNVGMKLHEIPHDDPATYQMIQACDTVGTFQIESRAQISMLGRLLPRNFYDLVIEVAIVRPGPIVGNMVHPFLKRRKGIEKITFPNEKVRKILGKTLGIPLFQEQIMRLAIELAHFSPGEADMLRRSVNAWRTSAPIAKMAQRLMEGLIEGGLPSSFAKQIFEQIQGFSQYGFPESHAASFALLAYASCYLKCHYPAEFTCALINSQPMGFYRNDTLVYDALRHGIQVLPVSFHHSQWDCEVTSPKSIRLGFRVVKGFAKKDAEALIQERSQKPFLGFQDLCARTTIRRDVLNRIAMAGGFEELKLKPREALWSVIHYENLLESATSHQMSLFELDTESLPEKGSFQALTSFETIKEDYGAFSLSTHGHPMSEIRKAISKFPKTDSQKIRNLKNGITVEIGGLALIRQKPPTAKGCMFSTLEDEFGFTDLIFHPEVYERNREQILNHCFIIVKGRLQRDANSVSVLVQEVRPIWEQGSNQIGLSR